VLFKLTLGFFQVVLLQPGVYDVQFPAVYLAFLDDFKWLSFELPFQSLHCFWRTDYHDRVTTAVIFSSTIMSVLLGGVVHSRIGKHDHQSRLLALSIVPSYLLYPSTSSVLFQTFNCREIDQHRMLAGDLSIDCSTSAHERAESIAWVMILLFSIGLPVMYQALLYPHRHRLASSISHEASSAAGAPASFRALSFLYADYKPRFYWWEAVEIVRKLLLTGALVQFQKGSLIQIVTAMVIIVVHMLMLANFKPYKNAKHGAIALCVYSVLLAIFFGALLLSAKAALPDSHVLQKGISTGTVALFLIVSVLAVVAIAIASAFGEIASATMFPVLYHVKSKRPVAFEHYPDPERFHLFLSHVWSTGQDQVLAIKKELTLIVPSLKIWLDVENLANIAGLEDNISNIDFTLMFLSKGYFTSWNCLREVRHATFVHSIGIGAVDTASSSAAAAVAEHRSKAGIAPGGALILVREAEEQMHGGAPLKTLLAECPGKVGCSEHVFSFDTGCLECGACSIDIRAALTAHADGPADVIDWIRFTDFKMVSLKQIVQQMLVVGPPSAGSSKLSLSIPGELTSRRLVMPTRPRTRVLLHRGCHLSDELPGMLRQVVPDIDISLLADGALGVVHEDIVLLVVVHDGCWTDARMVASLKFALENKIPVALLHEADADHRGCEFGSIIGQCPPTLSKIKGRGGMRLFDPIAVQFSRGAHQPISLHLLAISLGAFAQAAPGRCSRRAARSTGTPTESADDWAAFGNNEDEADDSALGSFNPLHPDCGGTAVSRATGPEVDKGPESIT
jgi:hypothetical protein